MKKALLILLALVTLTGCTAAPVYQTLTSDMSDEHICEEPAYTWVTLTLDNYTEHLNITCEQDELKHWVYTVEGKGTRIFASVQIRIYRIALFPADTETVISLDISGCGTAVREDTVAREIVEISGKVLVLQNS